MIKNILAKISDLPNAYRVLEIMDNAGCDIEKIESIPYDWYRIKPKWYVNRKEAEDLRTIILYKEHYQKRNKIWYKIFHNIRENCRLVYEYKK